MMTDTRRHEESWLLLPWLANGRLSGAERARVEQHVRECEACAREVGWQHLMGEALTEPDRVTYAPGPSFRKLIARIDGSSDARSEGQAPRGRTLRSWAGPAWRPPGLAWAASFVLLLAGAGMLAATAYRWSQPLYVTHSAATARVPGVLHIAFDRSLTIGAVEELLRSAGARVVEGPGTSGIFGVSPVGSAPQRTPNAHGVSPEVRALAARLRADPRVRWVEPLATVDAPEGLRRARVPQS